MHLQSLMMDPLAAEAHLVVVFNTNFSVGKNEDEKHQELVEKVFTTDQLITLFGLSNYKNTKVYDIDVSIEDEVS